MVDATGTFKLSNLMSTCFPEPVTETEVLHSLMENSTRSDGRTRLTMTPENGDVTIRVANSAAGGSSAGDAGGGLVVQNASSSSSSVAGNLEGVPWRKSRPWQSSYREQDAAAEVEPTPPPSRFWTVYEHEGTYWWSEWKEEQDAAAEVYQHDDEHE
jgi:hypothetical protein